MPKIKEGMMWHYNGYVFLIEEILCGNMCRVLIEWLDEAGEPCRDQQVDLIKTDGNGEEYACDPNFEDDLNFEEYARPAKKEYAWWARLYAREADYVPNVAVA